MIVSGHSSRGMHVVPYRWPAIPLQTWAALSAWCSVMSEKKSHRPTALKPIPSFPFYHTHLAPTLLSRHPPSLSPYPITPQLPLTRIPALSSFRPLPALSLSGGVLVVPVHKQQRRLFSLDQLLCATGCTKWRTIHRMTDKALALDCGSPSVFFRLARNSSAFKELHTHVNFPLHQMILPNVCKNRWPTWPTCSQVFRNPKSLTSSPKNSSPPPFSHPSEKEAEPVSLGRTLPPPVYCSDPPSRLLPE